MEFNVTFNIISVISWRSVLLVEKTTDLLRHLQTLSHNVVASTPTWEGFELTTLVVICTDYIGRCKYDHHHDVPYKHWNNKSCNKRAFKLLYIIKHLDLNLRM